jgi:hypothetical protein
VVFLFAGFAGWFEINRLNPLVEFTFLQSFFQQILAARRNEFGSSHGLGFPLALEVSKVHVSRVCLPAVFRLQGLDTLLTVYSLRAVPAVFQAGSAYGIHPSKLDSSRKVSMHFCMNAPACRFSRTYPHPFEMWRIADRDFRGFTLPRVPRPMMRI